PGYGEGSAELTVNVTKIAEPNIWKKITSQSDLSDGDYLIVYESGNVAFNGGLTTLDAVSNTIGVTITNNTIPYNTATVAAKFTIASISGGYSIKSASGKYIYGSSGSNNINTGTNETANQISVDSGNAEIVSNTSHLRYNSASDQARFRYYKSASYSSQQVIQLYKASYDSGTANVPTVSEVTVSPTSLSLDVYSNPSSTLTASVKGTNSPAQTVTWSTTNSAVVTVSDSGVVTAKGTGSAIIKATSTVDSSKYGSCTVTVTDSTPLTLSSISVSGQTTLFKVGDTFSFGGTVTAYFSNSTTSDVTSSATFSGYDMSTEGTQTVTVSYTYGLITKTTTYDITVSNTTTPSVTASTVKYSVDSTTSASVSEGTAPTGSSVLFNNTYTTKEQMTKNSSQTWKWTGYENTKISGIVIDMKRNSSSGSGTLTLTHNGFTITLGKTIRNSDLTATYTEYQILISEFEVEGDIELVINSTANSIYCDYVKITYSTIDNSDKIISSLSASYSGGSVFVGDSLDSSKVTVTATFTDSTKYPQEILSSSKYSLTGFSSDTSGTKTVVVTYTGTLSTSSSPMTTSFNVEVIEDTVKDVKVTSSKAYHPGEVITKSDLTVTLKYESGKEETTSDYDFVNDNYLFTYLDAPSGGSINTKNFSIKYNSNNYDFSVEVSRVAYQELPNTNKTLSSSQFSSSTISKSSSTESDTNVVIDEVKFTVTSNAYIYTKSSVSYLSFGIGAGSINNSEAFASDLTDVSISVRSGSRTDGVLSISKDGINYVNYDSSLLADGGYRFFKYEYTTSSSSTYSNISSISYTLKAADNPTNVSNYIMYEDTNGQCTTKLDVAIDKLNTMSNEDKATFWSSSDYVISTARERLQAWAAHEGRTLSYDEINHSYSVKNGLRLLSINNMNINLLTIVLISLFTTVSVCSVLVIKRKKDN
ncbi:MAG: bacterial Ig-like domain-containing protein, partial [Bacilli bacterium]|nr:bacterial Ig-like domain-containing protein [Bacilli bacterium]